jgi:hypothetical protein
MANAICKEQPGICKHVHCESQKLDPTRMEVCRSSSPSNNTTGIDDVVISKMTASIDRHRSRATK